MSISFKDLVTKPPVVFPLVALFHIILLLISLVTLIQVPAFDTGLSFLWMVGYTAFWLGAMALRKWGAMGYILVTAANIVTWYAIKDPLYKELYKSNLFLIDLIFSFFLILYYRRFR